MATLGKKPRPEQSSRPEQRVKVFVEASADGYLRVYGPDHADVIICNRPYASTAEAGMIVDQLIDHSLPFEYAKLYSADHLRATGLLCKLTPAKLRRTVDRLRICAVLNGKLPNEAVLIREAIRA